MTTIIMAPQLAWIGLGNMGRASLADPPPKHETKTLTIPSGHV